MCHKKARNTKWSLLVLGDDDYAGGYMHFWWCHRPRERITQFHWLNGLK